MPARSTRRNGDRERQRAGVGEGRADAQDPREVVLERRLVVLGPRRTDG